MVKEAIINADDFGKDEQTSEAIMDALRMELITQTTLMANMPYAEDAAHAAAKEGFADRVGLHLNLTEGIPITDAMRGCKVFCDAAGCFANKRPCSRWLSLDRKTTLVVAAEIECQVRRYLDLGMTLLHCDGHHHMQSWLPIGRILIPILKKYGFKSIRRPYSMVFHTRHPVIRSRILSFLWNMEACRFGLATAEDFGGWDNYVETCDLLGRVHTIEIMTHPYRDLDTGHLIDLTDFHKMRGRPLDMIASRLKSDQWRLVTYLAAQRCRNRI